MPQTGQVPPSPAAQTVGRIPQTTVAVPSGGSFMRYANDPGQLPAYTNQSTLFGGRLNLPLSAVSGFLKGIILTVGNTTGNNSAGSGVTVNSTTEAPWSTIATLDFRDAGGQPIYQPIDGFSLFCINLYSGQCGNGGAQDPRTLPSWTAISSGTGTGNGQFQFKFYIPFSVNSANYCSLPADNSAELPKLSLLLNPQSSVFTSSPSWNNVNISAELDFAPIPSNYAGLTPYDDGASAQWWIAQSAQAPPANTASRILDNQVGQFLHSKIYVLRDGSANRQDFFPSSDFSYYIDNYPYYSSSFIQNIYDAMAKAYFVGTSIFNARPTGVIALPWWRQSLMREVSDIDDLERILVTTGSTKLEIGGTWGNLTGVPTLTALTGQVFPGPSGWPYGSQSATIQAAGQATGQG